jgi:1-acyl-sn-glycerol-3-phosphate acyltransferase
MAKRDLPLHAYTRKRTHYGPIYRWMGRTFLRLLGWRLVGKAPEAPKCIVACAPHTTNWDFPLTLAAAMALSIPAVFMMKKEMFQGPLGWFYRWLGAIPVDRQSPVGIVDQMAQCIRESERINVVITPEGTRKNVDYWKLGFWRIAVASEVPILFGIINYEVKSVGVVDIYYPTGDLEKDWHDITHIFQQHLGFTPKYRLQDAEAAGGGSPDAVPATNTSTPRED